VYLREERRTAKRTWCALSHYPTAAPHRHSVLLAMQPIRCLTYDSGPTTVDEAKSKALRNGQPRHRPESLFPTLVTRLRRSRLAPLTNTLAG